MDLEVFIYKIDEYLEPKKKLKRRMGCWEVIYNPVKHLHLKDGGRKGIQDSENN